MVSAPKDELPPGITIRHDVQPGDMGYLIYLHGVLYARESGFDHTFEAFVANLFAEFIPALNDRQRLWIVEKNNSIVGSIAVAQSDQHQAKLRFLLLHPDIRRQGLGRFLMLQALDFCRQKNYRSAYLLTTASLKPAANLYLSLGFQLTQEKTHKIWGQTITEQRYDLVLIK